jgi:hypothetical protein
MTASGPGNADVGGLGNMLYGGAFRYPAQGPSCALAKRQVVFPSCKDGVTTSRQIMPNH